MSRQITFETTTTMVTESCCACGVLFAMTAEFEAEKRRQGTSGSFYCPNGHVMHYTGKSLKDQLAEEKRRRASAEEDARIAYTSYQTEQRLRRSAERRAKAAMCPVPGCKRQIVQMSRHLHAKHPDYVHPETPS